MILAHDQKIGLDIDEVICNWLEGWCNRYDMKIPSTWFFDDQIGARFADLKATGQIDEFYLSLNPKVDATELLFRPECYITSRPVDVSITRQWLDMHNFPEAPVHCVGLSNSKLEVAKATGIDLFVDDRFETFNELNREGVLCYLFDALHNREYNVGSLRLHDLNELVR